MNSEVERAKEKVLRRQQILMNAVTEYQQVVDRVLEEAKAEANSRPLSNKEMAGLLEITERTIYRRNINRCDTYAELWRWVKKHMPDKLPVLEKNYEQMVQS